MKNVTVKEIQIIYGYLYNINNFTNYVSGYRRSDEQYDVYEGPDSIKIYYEGSHWLQMPVVQCKLKEGIK